MKTFKQYIEESINDRGIFKAVFVIGIPGAGKSYVVNQLGGIGAKVVNTDRATEFLTKLLHTPSTDDNWSTFRDRSYKITREYLVQYVNGMLPLFVDGTSNDVSNILNRQGILESVGYDVGIVYVKTSLDVALRRADERGKKINRTVSPDFIKQVYNISEQNANYLEGKVKFFRTINNDSDELGDSEINKAFGSVESFYGQPVENVVGQRNLQKLKQDHQKYLVPTIFSMDEIQRKIDSWYRTA